MQVLFLRFGKSMSLWVSYLFSQSRAEWAERAKNKNPSSGKTESFPSFPSKSAKMKLIGMRWIPPVAILWILEEGPECREAVFLFSFLAVIFSSPLHLAYIDSALPLVLVSETAGTMFPMLSYASDHFVDCFVVFILYLYCAEYFSYFQMVSSLLILNIQKSSGCTVQLTPKQSKLFCIHTEIFPPGPEWKFTAPSYPPILCRKCCDYRSENSKIPHAPKNFENSW